MKLPITQSRKPVQSTLAWLSLVILSGCTTAKSILINDELSALKERTVRQVLTHEKELVFVDQTHKKEKGTGTSFHPNDKDLCEPQVVVKEEEYFSREVSYYYSKKDSLIQVAIYEWNAKVLKSVKSKSEMKRKFRKFSTKWNALDNELKEQLGQPVSKSIESTQYENKIITVNELTDNKPLTAWKDEMIWDGASGGAYLFLYGDNRTGYRQISVLFFVKKQL